VSGWARPPGQAGPPRHRSMQMSWRPGRRPVRPAGPRQRTRRSTRRSRSLQRPGFRWTGRAGARLQPWRTLHWRPAVLIPQTPWAPQARWPSWPRRPPIAGPDPGLPAQALPGPVRPAAVRPQPLRPEPARRQPAGRAAPGPGLRSGVWRPGLHWWSAALRRFGKGLRSRLPQLYRRAGSHPWPFQQAGSPHQVRPQLVGSFRRRWRPPPAPWVQVAAWACAAAMAAAWACAAASEPAVLTLSAGTAGSSSAVSTSAVCSARSARTGRSRSDLREGISRVWASRPEGRLQRSRRTWTAS